MSRSLVSLWSVDKWFICIQLIVLESLLDLRLTFCCVRNHSSWIKCQSRIYFLASLPIMLALVSLIYSNPASWSSFFMIFLQSLFPLSAAVSFLILFSTAVSLSTSSVASSSVSPQFRTRNRRKVQRLSTGQMLQREKEMGTWQSLLTSQEQRHHQISTTGELCKVLHQDNWKTCQ